MRMRHKLCNTTTISVMCCLHNQCPLLSSLSSSCTCMQGLPFHSPVMEGIQIGRSRGRAKRATLLIDVMCGTKGDIRL